MKLVLSDLKFLNFDCLKLVCFNLDKLGVLFLVRVNEVLLFLIDRGVFVGCLVRVVVVLNVNSVDNVRIRVSDLLSIWWLVIGSEVSCVVMVILLSCEYLICYGF